MKRIDWWLILPIVLLSSLGLLILRSAAPEIFKYQLGFMLLGIFIWIVVSLVDYKIFFAFWVWGYIVSIILLLLPIMFGNYVRGSYRWISLGPVLLQTSEIVKPILLVFVAMGIRKWYVILVMIPLFMIWRQPDLGSTLVLAAGLVTMVVSKYSLKKVFLWASLAMLILSLLARIFLHGYQKDRLTTFINPYADPLKSGYHVIQSVIAVGSGGLWGRGLGRGTQSQLNFLPERHTDFVFATTAEELGLVGLVLVLIMYSILLWRLNILMSRTSDEIAKAYLLGVFGMLLFQIFVNIGMNIGLVPVTGITLPFLSYGGSSLVSLMITFGLVQSIWYNMPYASRSFNRKVSISGI